VGVEGEVVGVELLGVMVSVLVQELRNKMRAKRKVWGRQSARFNTFMEIGWLMI
jgi:hypothetical protein